MCISSTVLPNFKFENEILPRNDRPLLVKWRLQNLPVSLPSHGMDTGHGTKFVLRTTHASLMVKIDG